MINNLITKIKGSVVVKTKDPLYKEAKLNLEKITVDVDKLINYVQQIENTLQKLSKVSLQLGEDMNQYYYDAPENQKLKAKTNLIFSKNFFALTNGFFIPRTNTNVISLLMKYKEEIKQINELKESVKVYREEYDKSRAVVTYLSQNPNVDKDKITQAIDKMEKDNQIYSNLNMKFINGINRLKDERETTFNIPFKNLTCLISQYMMQTFTEIQKYRISFPPETFTPKEYPKVNLQNNNQEE